MKPSASLTFQRPLRKHQADELDLAAFEAERFLMWEMGTGKTTAAIAWLRAKFNLAKAVTPTLIVSPVATLYNWQHEFSLNAPKRVQDSVLVPYMKSRRVKYTGVEKAALIASTDKKIIVINGEAFDEPAIVAALKAFAPVNFVLDESHKFKSYNLFSGNGRAKTPSRPEKLRTVSRHARNRMLLSGTPMLNGYLDLWSQYYTLDNGATFGTNFYTFRETYFRDKNVRWAGSAKYFPDWQPKPECAELIAAKLREKSSRLRKEDCLTLPPLEYIRHYVEMSPDQVRAYDSMEKQLVAEVSGGTCAAFNALAAINRLLQILSGHLPVEHEDNSEKVLAYFKTNPRLAAAQELLTELTPAHKVILWTSFKANYPKVREMLSKICEFAELTGETKNRQEEIDRFQNDPRCRVILANAQAGGVGVNLTAASYSIYYSRSYSLGDRLQSLARNHRGGSEQHEKITAIDLVVRDTLDEDVLSALDRKENLAENVLEIIRLRGTSASVS